MTVYVSWHKLFSRRWGGYMLSLSIETIIRPNTRKKCMGNIYLMKMPHNIKKLGISMLLSILNFIYFKKLKCILQWVFCCFNFLKLCKICWGQHFKYVLLACKYIYYMYLIHCLPCEYESGLPIIVLSIINVCVFYQLM
jgi:hypothetical protein